MQWGFDLSCIEVELRGEVQPRYRRFGKYAKIIGIMTKHTDFLFAEREAFTLIEVLTVIALMAMLSALVITYSSASRNEVSVSVEAAKISQTIFQAKTLAIATYANSSFSCGYGVSFDYNDGNGTYSIFAYNPSGVSSCPSSAAVATSSVSSDDIAPYSSSTWKISVARGVRLQKGPNSIAFVLFYPPDPTTFISRDGTTFTDTSQPSSNIYLAPVGNTVATEVISVNSAGQITL
jgi:prepilin-type N-terminal cleavage/methylation domain-containing protein